MSSQQGNQNDDQRLDLSFTRSTREIAVAALIGALIAVVTLVVIYFTYRGDFTNYGKQIESLDDKIAEQIAILRMDLKGEIYDLEKRIENITDLPEQIRRQVLLDTVREMGARTDFLGTQIEDENLKQKLGELKAVLGDVETSLSATD